MKSIRREHSSLRLLAHEREEIDPVRTGVPGLLAGELVEPFDRPRDHHRVAESRRGGGQRPIRLGQRDHACARPVTADALVDARELRAITISPGAPDPPPAITSGGGGPAGLTAGLYAARANMRAILLDSKDVGGEILNTELIEDYPGFESVTGSELAQKMAEHALKFGLKIETYKPVKEIRSEGDQKIVKLEDGTQLSAYAVIVTVGGEPTKLVVVGEKEYHGG